MASFFKELKPLMNSTMEASAAINRTAPILAWTQVLMIVLLAGIFLALFGLLVTLNPDLEAERQEFITPAVRLLLGYGVASVRKVRRAMRWSPDSKRGAPATATATPPVGGKSGEKKSGEKMS
ncbi:hypothetical protein LQW54_003761 [Pestalotiopsis sp. IQ-011]